MVFLYTAPATPTPNHTQTPKNPISFLNPHHHSDAPDISQAPARDSAIMAGIQQIMKAIEALGKLQKLGEAYLDFEHKVPDFPGDGKPSNPRQPTAWIVTKIMGPTHATVNSDVKSRISSTATAQDKINAQNHRWFMRGNPYHRILKHLAIHYALKNPLRVKFSETAVVLYWQLVFGDAIEILLYLLAELRLTKAATPGAIFVSKPEYTMSLTISTSNADEFGTPAEQRFADDGIHQSRVDCAVYAEYQLDDGTCHRVCIFVIEFKNCGIID